MRAIRSAPRVITASVLICAGTSLAEEPRQTPPATQPAAIAPMLALTVKDIDGNDVSLSEYAGDVCLVVNVASRCGLTPPRLPRSVSESRSSLCSSR